MNLKRIFTAANWLVSQKSKADFYKKMLFPLELPMWMILTLSPFAPPARGGRGNPSLENSKIRCPAMNRTLPQHGRKAKGFNSQHGCQTSPRGLFQALSSDWRCGLGQSAFRKR
ncbi:MAG: hypothetical protein WCS42_03065 [Verrucomicrobiota bacterium]